MLTSKSIGSQNWRYLYEGDRLVRQLENSTTAIDFLYGQEGLIGFVYGGNTYLYQKNIFGDIVKILNSAGSVVAEYSYTAFGECNVITNVNNIANVNPFRYRGYFYESNSGLYYLKTRFYNPVTGRFISPDSTKYLQPNTINGLNLYAYCLNNPVMNIDPNGTFSRGFSSIKMLERHFKRNKKLTAKSIKQVYEYFAIIFNIGWEYRTSVGWEKNQSLYSSVLGRIGVSQYLTRTKGKLGGVYGFSGRTTDATNLVSDTTYYAGFGLNVTNSIGVEFWFQTIGFGVQLSVGDFSVGLDINLTGTTSLTVGWDTELDNGDVQTKAFTIGVNTGIIFAVFSWIYKFLTTGDASSAIS